MKTKKEAGKRKSYLDSSKYDLIPYNWKSAGVALVLVLASLGALFALDGGSITGLTAKNLGGCLAVDLTDGKEQVINIKDGVLNSLAAGENTAKFKLVKSGKAYDFYLYPTDESLAKETIKSGETKQFYFSPACGGEADLLIKITTKSLIGKAFGGKDQAVLKWLKAPAAVLPEEGERPTGAPAVPGEEVPRIDTPKGILIDLSDGKLHTVNVFDEAKNVLIRIGPTDYRLVVDVTAENRANIDIYLEEEKVFGKKGASFKKAEYADLDADTKTDLYMMINNGKNKGLVEAQLRWLKPKEELASEEETGGEQIPIWDLSETDKEGELDDATGEIKFELGGKVYILKVDVSGTSCLNNAMSIYLNDASNISNLIAVNKAVITIKQFDLDKDGVNDLKVEIKSCKDHGKINLVLSWINKPAEAGEELLPEEVTIKMSAPNETLPAMVGKEVVFNVGAEQLGGELSSLILDFKVDPAKIAGAEVKEVSSEPGKIVKEFHWLPKKPGMYSVEFIAQGEVGGILYVGKSTVSMQVTGAKHKFSGYVTNGEEGQSVFVQTPELLFEEPITANKTYGKAEKEFMVYSSNGTTLMFFVNDTWILNYTLSDGQVTELNLTVPSTVTAVGGETVQAAPSGSPSGGGSGGGGYGPSKEEATEAPEICYYQWSCTDWSECFGGEQTRTCERTDECDVLLEANPEMTVIAYPKDAESRNCAMPKKEAAPKTITAPPKAPLEIVAPEEGEAAPVEKKKSKLGLILTLIAGTLLLAAAGVFIWWKMKKPKRPMMAAYPPLKR